MQILIEYGRNADDEDIANAEIAVRLDMTGKPIMNKNRFHNCTRQHYIGAFFEVKAYALNIYLASHSISPRSDKCMATPLTDQYGFRVVPIFKRNIL